MIRKNWYLVTLALVSPRRNSRSRAQTSIFTIENQHFLVQMAPQASWPSSMPLGLQNHCLGSRAGVILFCIDISMICEHSSKYTYINGEQAPGTYLDLGLQHPGSPLLGNIFWIFMRQFWVTRGLKMILSHRAPSSINMSSYRAIWTHFRSNSMISEQIKIPNSLYLNFQISAK